MLTNGPATIPVIYEIDSTGQLFPFAGGSASGKGPDSGPALNLPIGYVYCLAADSLGNLFICDSAYGRVREVTNGVMSTIAGSATAIGSPTAVAMDQSADIFIYASGQVLEIDSTGSLNSIATFSSVGGMATDPSGNLYLSDSGMYLREEMLVGPNGAPPVISRME